jgi:protein TonB
VDIQAAPPETTAISVVTQEKTPPPAPVVAAPVQHTIIGAKMDPKHPFKIGEEYYPDASKRAGEEGRCIVLAHVAANGNILDAQIQTSSGFPRLDDACLKGVKGQKALPGMEDGKPVDGQFAFAIVWKLTGK